MERKLRVIISTNDQEKFRQLFDRLPLKDGKSVHLMKDYSSYLSLFIAFVASRKR